MQTACHPQLPRHPATGVQRCSPSAEGGPPYAPPTLPVQLLSTPCIYMQQQCIVSDAFAALQ